MDLFVPVPDNCLSFYLSVDFVRYLKMSERYGRASTHLNRETTLGCLFLKVPFNGSGVGTPVEEKGWLPPLSISHCAVPYRILVVQNRILFVISGLCLCK